MRIKKVLDVDKFKELAALGCMCKDIMHALGYKDHNFGHEVKKVLGVYPSVYIANLKKGEKK